MWQLINSITMACHLPCDLCYPRKHIGFRVQRSQEGKDRRNLTASSSQNHLFFLPFTSRALTFITGKKMKVRYRTVCAKTVHSDLFYFLLESGTSWYFLSCFCNFLKTYLFNLPLLNQVLHYLSIPNHHYGLSYS